MSDYLLVHGAFNGGWVWDSVAEQLLAAGHRIRVVQQLPSGGTDSASLGDLSADADHVRQVLDTAAEPVVLVGHSYAGMVITDDFELAWQSFCPDLDRDRSQTMLSRFALQSAASYSAPSMAPDRTHPATYIIAAQESDNSVAAQEAWSANADFVVRMDAGHMVPLSRPRELAEALGRI